IAERADLSVEVDVLHPYASGNTLAIFLPLNPGSNTVHLTLGGSVEHLQLTANAAPLLDIVYLGNAHLESLVLTGIADISLLRDGAVPAGDDGSIDANTIDATLFTGTLSIPIGIGKTVYGGDANNFIVASGPGGTVLGGAGDDDLRAY